MTARAIPSLPILVLALALTLVGASPAAAQITHQVTITNITANQIISPPIIVSHNLSVSLFDVGKPASPALAAVAEDADASTLLAALEASPDVFDFAIAGGPLMPGHSVTLELQAQPPFIRFSAVGMLVTTNDAFFGVDSYFLLGEPRFKTLQAPAYDAGSEANNESCAFIPGPPCGNPFMRDTAGAEGVVHIHPGIQGRGDLAPENWSWLNPVVEISIRRFPPVPLP